MVAQGDDKKWRKEFGLDDRSASSYLLPLVAPYAVAEHEGRTVALDGGVLLPKSFSGEVVP